MPVTIVEDLVSGIIGCYSHREPAPGREGRYNIYYRDSNAMGWMSKPKKLPYAIPLSGMLEIPQTRSSDSRSRIIVFSYGDDEANPPLIMSLIKERVGDLIRNIEIMQSQMTTKQESLSAEKRIFDRSKQEEFEKIQELAKTQQQQQMRPRQPGFLNISEEE